MVRKPRYSGSRPAADRRGWASDFLLAKPAGCSHPLFSSDTPPNRYLHSLFTPTNPATDTPRCPRRRTPSPTDRYRRWSFVYLVRENDTLPGIADKFQVDLLTIYARSHIDPKIRDRTEPEIPIPPDTGRPPPLLSAEFRGHRYGGCRRSLETIATCSTHCGCHSQGEPEIATQMISRRFDQGAGEHCHRCRNTPGVSAP
jgi:hypothetical protein